MGPACANHLPPFREQQQPAGIKMDGWRRKSVVCRRRVDLTLPMMDGSYFCYVCQDLPLLSCKHCKKETPAVFWRSFYPLDSWNRKFCAENLLIPFNNSVWLVCSPLDWAHARVRLLLLMRSTVGQIAWTELLTNFRLCQPRLQWSHSMEKMLSCLI